MPKYTFDSALLILPSYLIGVSGLERGADESVYMLSLVWSETMPKASEQEYYAQRAAKAAELALAATEPHIAEIHKQLAENYRELARYAGGPRPPLKVVQDS